MGRTTIDICNIALGKLGGNIIMDLGDGTVEADLCDTNYEQSRDQSLEAVDWTFARKRLRITPLTGAAGLIEGSDFANRFQLPSDCLVVRWVSADGSFKDRVRWDKEAHTLLADEELLYIKYTSKVIDPNLFSSGFVRLYSTQLAADICIPLTANKKLRTELNGEADSFIDIVGGTDGVQTLPQKQKANRLIDARFGYGRGF